MADRPKRASMREGPLAALFRRTDEEGVEDAPAAGPSAAAAAPPAPAPATPRPAIATVPRSGRSKPAMTRRSVDLPDPLGPSSAKSSPGRTSSVASSRARAGPNQRATPRTEIAGSIAALGYPNRRCNARSRAVGPSSR